MAELKYPKRVKFLEGKQKEFLELIKNRLNLTHAEMAKLAGVHIRSFTDWRREKLSMSLPAVKILCKKANIPLPSNIQIKDPFWYVSSGSSAGGIAHYKKYGRVAIDEEYRKKRWYEWWNKAQYSHPLIQFKPFKKPRVSIALAEFFGMMLGDGGTTKSQIIITLNKETDKEYGGYVIGLMKKLFDIKPSVYYDPNSLAEKIVISRSGLIKYLHSIGLIIGHKIKQECDIPDWIKQKTNLCKACVRGLVDTDGCVFFENHKMNKAYSYPRINFTSASPKLIQSVFDLLNQLNLRPRIRRSGRSIQIEDKKDIINYLKIIGSSNPKHLKKIQKIDIT